MSITENTNKVVEFKELKVGDIFSIAYLNEPFLVKLVGIENNGFCLERFDINENKFKPWMKTKFGGTHVVVINRK